MKTLADLKRNLRNYRFSLVHNSWFKGVPSFQFSYRGVGTVRTNKFSLLTAKNNDGTLSESWIDFPKASEMELIKLNNDNDDYYRLIIKRVDCMNETHTMIYELQKTN